MYDNIIAAGVAAWIAAGAFILVLASVGNRRRLEEDGFYPPFRDIGGLAAIVISRITIVVCAGPALLVNPAFRAGVGSALIRLGRWL